MCWRDSTPQLVQVPEGSGCSGGRATCSDAGRPPAGSLSCQCSLQAWASTYQVWALPSGCSSAAPALHRKSATVVRWMQACLPPSRLPAHCRESTHLFGILGWCSFAVGQAHVQRWAKHMEECVRALGHVWTITALIHVGDCKHHGIGHHSIGLHGIGTVTQRLLACRQAMHSRDIDQDDNLDN